MRFFHALLLAIMAALTTAELDNSRDGFACMTKHGDVARAIGQFCANKNIGVPSTYASNGQGWNGKRVFIVGNCKLEMPRR